MWNGCYVLHLYCDEPGCVKDWAKDWATGQIVEKRGFAELEGSDRAAAFRRARRRHWHVGRRRRDGTDGPVFCPHHNPAAVAAVAQKEPDRG